MKFKISIVTLAAVIVLAASLLLAGCAGLTPEENSPAAPSNNTASPVSSPTTGAGISLVVSQPQDNAITDSEKIEIKGTTTPGAIVSALEEITIADSQGNFSLTIPLEEGANFIEVLASDEDGNEANVALVITFVRGG